MNDRVFTQGKQKMDEVILLVENDLLTVQTGRAKPSMVENVKVEAYAGSYMEIREVANISAPDSNSLVIKPWDPSTLEAIEKGIQKSNLQVNPVIDGDLIRISVPSLNEERRIELVKLVKQKIESGKAMLRQVRIEMKKDIDNKKDEAGVSEDDIHQMYDELKDLMDSYNQKLDTFEEGKEKELMSL